MSGMEELGSGRASDDLAAYMAMSALRNRSSADSANGPLIATPMLARDGGDDAADLDRLAQGVGDPDGDRRARLLVGDALEQHRELVPAEAGRGVARAQDPGEPLGDGDEDVVAAGMAERVVERP